MNPFDQKAPVAGVKNIILVGSGKGGVGKSTVAANLSLSLKALGHKVGLLDADIYGPSVPRLFGAVNQAPKVNEIQKIEPLIRHGVKLMSMGFLVEEGSAVVWRGPMLFKAMDQFFRDVTWGELDYLVVDLPPGTGDIALTIAQKVPVAGAIVVTTPQNLSLIDARKAVDMFERIDVPLIGAVENMSYLIPEPGKEPIQLFPKGDLDSYLDTKQIPKLGEIPFSTQVGISTEAGMPIALSDPDSEESKVYKKIAESTIEILLRNNETSSNE